MQTIDKTKSSRAAEAPAKSFLPGICPEELLAKIRDELFIKADSWRGNPVQIALLEVAHAIDAALKPEVQANPKIPFANQERIS